MRESLEETSIVIRKLDPPATAGGTDPGTGAADGVVCLPEILALTRPHFAMG